MAGIYALFYAVAFLGLAARRERARRLRAAGRFSTAFIAFMFVATYLPLVARSPWYALPATIVTLAVVVDAKAGKLRRLRCFTDATSEAHPHACSGERQLLAAHGTRARLHRFAGREGARFAASAARCRRHAS